MKTNSVLTFWKEFCLEGGVDAALDFQVWFFGNTPEMASELVQLVITGKKFATASLALVNEVKPEETPKPDGYSVITDFYGTPICVIQTTEIRHLPFEEVDAQFAADEGEGDQTLDGWRRVHWQYFTREAAELELPFDKRAIVCCERFSLMYPR